MIYEIYFPRTEHNGALSTGRTEAMRWAPDGFWEAELMTFNMVGGVNEENAFGTRTEKVWDYCLFILWAVWSESISNWITRTVTISWRVARSFSAIAIKFFSYTSLVIWASSNTHNFQKIPIQPRPESSALKADTPRTTCCSSTSHVALFVHIYPARFPSASETTSHKIFRAIQREFVQSLGTVRNCLELSSN